MAQKENVVAVILGGGAGSRLFPLTRERSKPAVPLGGKYRLIDVPISNCINSNINRIFVLTRWNVSVVAATSSKAPTPTCSAANS